MSLLSGFHLDKEKYTSSDFSDAFHSYIENGVSRWGGRFELSLPGGTVVSILTGYMYIAGRWIKSNKPQTFQLQNPFNTRNRYDAIVGKVNHHERRVSLELLSDVDPVTIEENPDMCLLYVITVRRAAIMILESDIDDKRKFLYPLSTISNSANSAYMASTGGADEKIAQAEELTDSALLKAQNSLNAANAVISAATGRDVGSVTFGLSRPADNWLLCGGTAIPWYYRELFELYSGRTPTVYVPDDMLEAWVYAGDPVDVGIIDSTAKLYLDSNKPLVDENGRYLTWH